MCVCSVIVSIPRFKSKGKKTIQNIIQKKEKKNVLTVRRNNFIGAWKKNVFIKEQSKGNSNL